MSDWPNVLALVVFLALGIWLLAFSHLPVWQMVLGIFVLFVIFAALVLRFTPDKIPFTRGAP